MPLLGGNVFHLVRGSTYFLLLVLRSCDHVYIHCAYLWYIYIYMMMYVFFTCLYICCFFFIFIHMFLIFVCNLFFLSHTKMPWWVLFKVFQKYRLSKSSLSWTLFLQSFSRVCVRIDFIVFNKWVWVKWFMSSLICSFVCCSFVTDCQRGRLLRTYFM